MIGVSALSTASFYNKLKKPSPDSQIKLVEVTYDWGPPTSANRSNAGGQAADYD